MNARVQKYAHSFVIASAMMHLFCCGLPFILSFAGLFAGFGLGGASFGEWSWFERHEVSILLLSTAIIGVSALAQWIAARTNCRTQGSCKHSPCDGKKKRAKNIFILAIVIYIFNVCIFFASHAYASIGHIH